MPVIDQDLDGVLDEDDNCIKYSNPVVSSPLSGRTYTDHGSGYQIDDDADDEGNACDADYDQTGPAVLAKDFNDMVRSLGKLVTGTNCGCAAGPPIDCNSNGTMACKLFDTDGAAGGVIITADFNRPKALTGKLVNPNSCKVAPYNCSRTACTGPACP
jgi:hypothetical protein